MDGSIYGKVIEDFGKVIENFDKGFKQLALIILGIFILLVVGAFYLGRARGLHEAMKPPPPTLEQCIQQCGGQTKVTKFGETCECKS